MAAITGLNHITLAVGDLQRSLGFYQGLLGMELRAEWPEGAYLEAGSLWLCLALAPNRCATSTPDYTHIALSVTDGGFDALAARITADAERWRENRSEGDSLYFLDPDGHKLELHDGSLASRLAHYRANPVPGRIIHDG